MFRAEIIEKQVSAMETNNQGIYIGYLLFWGEYQIYSIECGEKIRIFHNLLFGGEYQSKNGDKDQESIQSSTTPDPEYHMGK